MLARGFAADVRQQQAATAALVAELAGVRQLARVGAHERRSLEQLAAECGAGAVVRAGGQGCG